MPKNCSSDIAAAISYIDNTLTSGTPDQQTRLKAQFGMESVASDDFADALKYPFGTWQDLQASDYASQGESLFYTFCDAIETLQDGTQNTGQ